MVGQHKLAELAPRDVVAKAIMRQMEERQIPHVWLDARHLNNFAERFPTINASCINNGIDPSKDLIPVAPASHYASGGVRVNENGLSSITGLYACGETACSGVHGANRLASNSLLEGLVFSARIAEHIAANRRPFGQPVKNESPSILIDSNLRKVLQHAMSEGAGVLRSKESLTATAITLSEIRHRTTTDAATKSWETTNLYQLAQAILKAALLREETRGSHWREDFPESNKDWQKRINLLLVDDHFDVTYEEVAS